MAAVEGQLSAGALPTRNGLCKHINKPSEVMRFKKSSEECVLRKGKDRC